MQEIRITPMNREIRITPMNSNLLCAGVRIWFMRPYGRDDEHDYVLLLDEKEALDLINKIERALEKENL